MYYTTTKEKGNYTKRDEKMRKKVQKTQRNEDKSDKCTLFWPTVWVLTLCNWSKLLLL